MDIRSYLIDKASAITDQSLTDLPSVEAWPAEQARRRTMYLDRMGLTPYLAEARTPPKMRITQTLYRQGYRIEKLYFESLPQLYVSANLYVPKNLRQRTPAVAYFCGHSRTQKIHYQSHARRFCELGFVTLIVDTIQYGEIKGEHHGCYSQGRFHWYSRGYNPAAVECWNGIRALDLLESRPEVDGSRMGITGISGGGGMSWWLGAADERARVVAPVCGTGTRRSHAAQRTIDGHCDCMFYINPDGWDLADVAALIAPRPLLIASANMDGLYTIDAIRETYGKIKALYTRLGIEDRLQLIETPGEHSYHPTSRKAIYSLFLRELMGKDVPPEDIDDLDTSDDEPDEDALKVYWPGTNVHIPRDERVTVIDDQFIHLAKPEILKSKESLVERKAEVIAGLRKYSFQHFPQDDAPLDAIPHMRYEDHGRDVTRFWFNSEGWRLSGTFARQMAWDAPHGVILSLRSPGEARWAGEGFVGHLTERYGVAHVETRGCGESGWSEELSWHVRRASALTGRTVMSMRVYDTLRAIQATQQLPGVDSEHIVLAARGEMCVAALCAALLDESIRAVALADPPATLNQVSQPDGRGPAIELLNALRITDLAEIAALLWPRELIFVGWRPETYLLMETTYRELGHPGVIRHVKQFDQWPG